MGGERASTVRQREAGKICANCHGTLPYRATREQLCDKCGGRRHRVYMHFMHRDCWFCRFLEEDLKTPLPRKVRLTDPAKIIEMAAKGGAAMRLEDRQALDYGISVGRGSVWLNLTADQYQKLKRVSRKSKQGRCQGRTMIAESVMSNFTCKVVGTPLHRHIVDVSLGDKMLIVTPKSSDGGSGYAQEIVDFLNQHVASIVWAPVLQQDVVSCAEAESA